MIRNLKALGLILGAIVGLTAALVSSASAETPGVLTTDGTSATIVGVEIGGSAENYWEGGGTKIECPGSTFRGDKANVTPHEPVPANATEITVTPEYRNCSFPIDMNGCDYRAFEATTTGGVAGTYGGKLSVVCPGTNKIRMTQSPCNILVGPQTVTGGHLTNESGSPDDVRLSGEGPTAATACGIPINATMHFNITISGQNEAGEPTEITVSHN